MIDIETGAEAGGESDSADKPYIEQIAEEQAAAEAAEDAGGGQEPPEPPAETVAAPDDPEKPAEGQESPQEPLTTEEYQKRHRDITTALREERQEKRQLRDELAALRAEVTQIRETQPQQFQQMTLDQQISEYADINWVAWYSQDPDAAAQGQARLEALVAQKETAENQSRQAHEQRQNEQRQNLAQRFQDTLNTEVAEYQKVKPDYQQAVQFLHDDLVKEANLEGYYGPQADEYANRRVLEVAVRVFSAGQNMPAVAYKAAEARGYKPPAPDIASIKAGAEAAKTISNLGKKSSNEGGTFEETMGGLHGAAARDFWAKAKRQQYA